MRKKFHLITYALWLLFFKTKNNIFTYLLHIKLYLNDVRFNKNLKAVNGIPSIHIHHKATKCQFGNNVILRSYMDVSWSTRTDITVKRDATLVIGNYTGISGSLIYCSNRIEIGNNVMIGGGCRIFETDFHPIEATRRTDPKTVNDGKSAPVIIEDNVFIGTNSIIGKGIRIGNGAVVAAGSVVVKSIPANEIWGGNPAKFLKKIEQ